MKLINKIKSKLGFCEEKGCWSRQTEIWKIDEDYSHRFCYNHNYGFCWGCGGFYGGVEDFEMSESRLCFNCKCFDCGQHIEMCICNDIEPEYEDYIY